MTGAQRLTTTWDDAERCVVRGWSGSGELVFERPATADETKRVAARRPAATPGAVPSPLIDVYQPRPRKERAA